MTIGYVLTYDGSLSSTAVPELIVQSVDRDLMPGIRDEWKEIPGLSGSVFFGENDGDRQFSMDCRLVAADRASRRAGVRALAEWLRKPVAKPLVIDNEPDRFWLAKIDSSIPVSEKVLMAGFTLSWRVGPFAESVSTQSVSATATSATPVAVDTSGSEIEVEPIIEITATSNNAAGFSINVGGTVLTYGDNVSIGNTFTISCVSQVLVTGLYADEELDTGAFNVATLDMAEVTGSFGVLPADGTGTVTVTGVNCTMRVVWRARFL